MKDIQSVNVLYNLKIYFAWHFSYLHDLPIPKREEKYLFFKAYLAMKALND